MNKPFENQWGRFQGKVKEKWNRLSENDIAEVAGQRDILLDKLQSVYGYDEDEAERELSTFERGFDKVGAEGGRPTRDI